MAKQDVQVHTMSYVLALKNEILTYMTVSMNLKGTALSGAGDSSYMAPEEVRFMGTRSRAMDVRCRVYSTEWATVV